jgi:hypothetical protein
MLFISHSSAKRPSTSNQMVVKRSSKGRQKADRWQMEDLIQNSKFKIQNFFHLVRGLVAGMNMRTNGGASQFKIQNSKFKISFSPFRSTASRAATTLY